MARRQTTPEEEGIEIDHDAWPRFEKLIKSAAKTGPKPAAKDKARPASKGRVRKGRSRS